jgi:hypothetical protein
MDEEPIGETFWAMTVSSWRGFRVGGIFAQPIALVDDVAKNGLKSASNNLGEIKPINFMVTSCPHEAQDDCEEVRWV